jgi:L-fuculose-phosphate aldolase
VDRIDSARRQVADACRRLRADGLVVGTAGNVSVRVGDRIVVSPSGVDYDRLTPDLVGVHTLAGEPVDAPLLPSSELPLHLAIYRRYGAGAVVHTHAPASTAVSIVATALPAYHYYIALFGGPVRVAPYATFGTEALAANVVGALAGRSAALMANHGALTTGADLATAYRMAAYLEYLCDVHLRVLSTGLPPARPLSEADLESAVAALRSYGQEGPPAVR